MEMEFLKKLKFTDEIEQRILSEQEVLKLDETVIGVHARGTDFNTPLSVYADQISKYISMGYSKFFVCSDSIEYENGLKERFGEKIILRERKVFVDKAQKNAGWRDNVNTTTESVKDSIVDMILLAKTNFKIFNGASTFAIIVKKLKGEV